ncbi:MAG: aminotransferase class IV [Saprospiraceae bacterium]|nr:aminotransferase class IV [Saprospiraceae bacterium]
MSNDTSHDWNWVNGQVIPGQQPVVHANDQGFTLGMGLFETIAVVNCKMVNVASHLHRLLAGLQQIGAALSSEELNAERILHDLLDKEPGRHGVLRITVTPGRAGRGLNVQPVGTPTIVARFSELGFVSTHPVDLHIASVRKNPDSPSSYLKSTHYLDHIMALREARDAGADDALLLTVDGRISCSTTANVIIWDGHQLKQPDVHAAALPGTTLALLNALLPAKRKIHAAPLTRLDLDVAKGVYLVNSLKGIQPVNAIGDRRYYSDLNGVYAEMTKILRAYVVAECGEHVGEEVFPWLGEG